MRCARRHAIALFLAVTVCEAGLCQTVREASDDTDDIPVNFTSLLQSSVQMIPRTATSQWDGLAKVCNDVVQVRGSTKPMPSVGYIACCDPVKDNAPAVALEGATRFLQRGGRLLDTAQMYGNEEAIGAAIQQSGVPREEVFVSSKLAVFDLPSTGLREWVAGKVQESLQTMNLSYLDVMHIHYGPTAARFSGHSVTPQQDLEMYQGLIDAQKEGKVRNIGVCMHTRSEIEHLNKSTGVPPAIAMLWYSPFLPEVTHEYTHWLQSQGIAVLAYGLLNWKYETFPFSSDHMQTTMAVADRSNATFGQIIIRWALDVKIAMITSMSNQMYLNEDLHCLPNELSEQDHLSLARSPRWTCEDIEPMQALMGCYP